jgi:hypothetical protein
MTTGGDRMDTIPMPENAIVIHSQDFSNDTVDFTVNQQWIIDEAGLAIQSGMDACVIKSNMTFGDSENIEGECYDGLLGVTIVVYMDEEFDADECEACSVEDLSDMGGDYKFCAYRVEIPCEPMSVECGAPSAEPSVSPSDRPSSTPSTSPSASPSSNPTANPTASMAPTDCFEPPRPQVIESMCMTTGGELMDVIPMPQNAIVVNSQDFSNDTIDFIVSQQWKTDTDDVGLAIEAGLDSCIVKGNVTFGESESVQGECYDGFAGVTIVVYMDEDFEPDECEACNVDDLSDMGGNYSFCAYRVEIPCEPVSVECGAPSTAPSESSFPSSAPSDAPTESAEPSDAPSDRPTLTAETQGPTPCPPSDPILVANEGETMYPDLPVTITRQNTTHVAFTVENTFGSTVSSVFTEYHSGSFGETECLEEENVEQNSEVEIEFVAQCMHHTKISIVNVWITDCNEALPFLDQADNAEVPECCHPGKECRTVQYTFKLPCVSPCPDDEVATKSPVSAPTGAPVNGGQFGRPDEYSTGNEATKSPTIAPISDPTAPPVNGEQFGRPDELSTGNEGAGSRRNLAATNSNEGSTEDFEALTERKKEAEPSDDSEEPFCVIEDYPCGPNNDKVYVCHYSARDGYKTFCVPEADSDALRFYPKDYCGQCVGGYAHSS